MIIGCIQRIQQLSERSLLLVYSSRFIVDLKIIDNGCIQQIQQLSERLVIIARDWNKLLDPR